ncbi:Uncharacterised protein [Vibrio cholerae]|nr:Uncharacterised protein [Vibrio cholerae]CSI69782.1 Uncharacterised protein [Vibrio cholerae]
MISSASSSDIRSTLLNTNQRGFFASFSLYCSSSSIMVNALCAGSL